jgi:hypothetical protein
MRLGTIFTSLSLRSSRRTRFVILCFSKDFFRSCTLGWLGVPIGVFVEREYSPASIDGASKITGGEKKTGKIQLY